MKILIKAICHPVWAIKRIKQKFIVLPAYQREHLNSLKQLLTKNGYDMQDYENIVNEFIGWSEIHGFVNRQLAEQKIDKVFPPDRYSWVSLLYFLIRKTKPAIIIETGCWYGNSSTCILAALHKNKTGRLYTIDLPALFETGGYYDENPYLNEKSRTASLPQGKMPGFIVPDFLKDQWQLILGPTSEKLPPLLEDLKKIDFFLHDSLHSVDNMTFEFNTAYSYLKKNGILASDNIDWNNVFHSFSENKKYFTYLAYYESDLLKHNFGMIVKE